MQQTLLWRRMRKSNDVYGFYEECNALKRINIFIFSHPLIWQIVKMIWNFGELVMLLWSSCNKFKLLCTLHHSAWNAIRLKIPIFLIWIVCSVWKSLIHFTCINISRIAKRKLAFTISWCHFKNKKWKIQNFHTWYFVFLTY